MHPADAIVYDFGNVLVEIDFERVVATWARHAGVPVESLRPRFFHGLEYAAHERGQLDAVRYFEALRGDLGIDLTDELFADGWNAVFGDPIAPTVEIVRKLVGVVPQYVLSNTNAAHHAFWSKRYRDVLAPLDGVFASHEMGLRKPDRAAYEKLAESIGVEPGRILFFDDLPVNVEGARAAGLQAVVVRSTEDVARAVEPWLGETAPLS